MQRFAGWLGVLVASIVWAASSAAQETRPAPTPEDVGAFVDAIVAGELARSDVAGAVVVVVANGAPALATGYGFADVAKRIPVDDRTLFRQASISKLVTALAVLQLVEQGALDLDADVSATVGFALPEAGGKPVTLRQLLTHRAGFEERLRDLAHANAPPLPLGVFVRAHLPRRARAPEASPSYSNYGFALAGYAVERAAGMPFERYAAERIFAPLGMVDATFAQPLPAALGARMSRGYVLGSGAPGPFEVINDAPAGALTASGASMGRFLRMLLGGGELDGVRVISPAGFAQWIAPQVTVAGNALGLAIYESHPHGVRTLGHGGDLSHFHCELHALPEHGFGVYVAQNSLGKGPRLLLNALVPALVKRYFADAPRPAGPAFEKTPAAALEGSYMTTRRSDVSWMRLQGLLGQVVVRARADGALEARGLTDAAGNPERFREVAPGSFRSGDGEREIAFVRDAAGRAIELQPWFPGLTYERARFWDTQDVALAVFAPAAAIALGVLLAPLVGALARRALGAPPAPPRGLGARWLGRATAAAWLAGLGGFAAFGADAAQNVWRFSEREDAPLAAAIFAIWGAAVLSVACAATTARELRAARALTPARRFARALPALAFLALTWFAWNWALLSNPARY